MAGSRLARQLQSKPALADAADTGKGEQAGTPQAGGELSKQASAADKACGRLGKVMRDCCRHRLAAREQAPVESCGLWFWFGGILLVEGVAQPLVRLDGLPSSTETGEHIDQHTLQAFVEGTGARDRLQKSKGGFLFALRGQLRSQQRHDRGRGLGEPVAMLLCPIRVLIFGEQRAGPECECLF